MKKSLSTVLIFALGFAASVSGAALAAQGDNANNPIVITTAKQLDAMRNGLDKHYKLGADIDLAGFIKDSKGWLPIGGTTPDGEDGTDDNSARFTGSLDGNRHKITGLWINRDRDYVGLFGYVDRATIKNLSVAIADKGVTGRDFVGGLTGFADTAIIANCSVTGNVTGKESVGGITGDTSGRKGSIENSYFEGGVTGSSYRAGGLAGGLHGKATKCYVVGSVTGGSIVGGLTGFVWDQAELTNNFTMCEVTGSGDRIAEFYGDKRGGVVKDNHALTRSARPDKKTFTDNGWTFYPESAEGPWYWIDGQYPQIRAGTDTATTNEAGETALDITQSMLNQAAAVVLNMTNQQDAANPPAQPAPFAPQAQQTLPARSVSSAPPPPAPSIPYSAPASPPPASAVSGGGTMDEHLALQEQASKLDESINRIGDLLGSFMTSSQAPATAPAQAFAPPSAEPSDPIECMRHLAGQGDAQAMFELGRAYLNGNGVAKDGSEAALLFRRAAELGHPDAQNNYAVCLDVGNGVARDRHKAMAWFQKAAMQGNARAQTNLGQYYFRGEVVPQNYAEAFRLFQAAANSGFPEAQALLGYLYYNGFGTPQDYTEAVKWLRLAVEQGNVNAHIDLGLCYYRGHGVPVDKVEAARLARIAAEKGHAQAQHNLGLYYRGGNGVPQDIAQAELWFRKAANQGHQDSIEALERLKSASVLAPAPVPVLAPAEPSDPIERLRYRAGQGDATAQCNLGLAYQRGDGVPRDPVEAARLYRMAAEQGLDVAQFNLGVCYDKGTGVPIDKSQAAHWYRLAAEQGDSSAQNNLGLLYERGEGVPMNHAEAVRLYTLAANQGNSNGLFSLAVCYDNGEGVPINKAEAVRLYLLAAEKNSDRALHMLGVKLFYGIDVQRDLDKAKWYFQQAASQGYQLSIEMLEHFR